MYGTPIYDRVALDFYPTPASATNGFLQIYEDDLPSFQMWEPFVGNGAIAKLLAPHVRGLFTSDLVAYDGYDADLLSDFFAIKSVDEIEEQAGFRPDAIITNPPYGKIAGQALRHSLKLMEPERGFVAFLLRHDYDTAKTRSDLFDHPAFAAKVTLRHRPRWFEGTTTAPRHNFAWFVWDWTRPGIMAPELKYAA